MGLAAAAGFGCGDDVAELAADAGYDAVPPSDAGTPVAQVGVGLEYTPVEDDQTVILVLGPQGGQHIEMNGYMENLYPGIAEDDVDAPKTQYDVLDEDGVQWDIPLRPFNVSYVPNGDGGYVMRNSRYLFMEQGSPQALDGQRVNIQLTVTDVDGRTATDSRWVYIQTLYPDI